MKHPGNFHEDVYRSYSTGLAPPPDGDASLACPIGVGNHIARTGIRSSCIFEGHLIVVRHQTKRGPVEEGIVEESVHLHA